VDHVAPPCYGPDNLGFGLLGFVCACIANSDWLELCFFAICTCSSLSFNVNILHTNKLRVQVELRYSKLNNHLRNVSALFMR
jgi:hypothetical protein